MRNPSDKRPLESKKFIAFATASGATVAFTLTGLAIVTFNPSVSNAVVSLLTVALASINGAASVYAAGQSAVDWKINNQTLPVVQSTSTTNINPPPAKRYEVKY